MVSSLQQAIRRTRETLGLTVPAPLGSFNNLDRTGRMLKHETTVREKKSAAVVAVAVALGSADQITDVIQRAGEVTSATPGIIGMIGAAALAAYNGTQAIYHNKELQNLIQENMQVNSNQPPATPNQ